MLSRSIQPQSFVSIFASGYLSENLSRQLLLSSASDRRKKNIDQVKLNLHVRVETTNNDSFAYYEYFVINILVLYARISLNFVIKIFRFLIFLISLYVWLMMVTLVTRFRQK